MFYLILATWSEWTECLGSCTSSRRRVCSELYGCNGLEYEEKDCPNADDRCFQQLSDTLPNGKNITIYNFSYLSIIESKF